MPRLSKRERQAQQAVEQSRRNEVMRVADALIEAHNGQEVGQALARMLGQLCAAWGRVDEVELKLDGAHMQVGSMQQRMYGAQRELRETQVRLEALRVQTSPERVTALEAEVRTLRAQLAEARAETLRARQGRPTAGPVLGSAVAARAAAMPADASWHMIRQQAALRSTVAMMRPELLSRADALEVRQLCTLLTVAAEGSARAAAVEDLRAALVLLRSRAARDSLSPKDASVQDAGTHGAGTHGASTPGASFKGNSFQAAS